MEPLAITYPRPLTVVQRTTVSPGLGSGTLRVEGSGAPDGAVRAELRTVLCPEASGAETPWIDAGATVTAEGTFSGSAVVPAGGWFRLEVRLLDADGTPVALGVVEPVGVGEVFVVAGQSYSVSCHERILTVDDPMCRMVSASAEETDWRFGHDPQPGIKTRIDLDALAEIAEVLAELKLDFPHGEHSPFQGSVWPAFGSRLIVLQQVPVAVVHAGVGATRVGHWKPGSQLLQNVVDAVGIAGDYRAVLWQQGESDVAYGTSTEEYVAALTEARSWVVEQTGLDRPWLVAQSTHHPTGERPVELEAAIIAAHRRLAYEPGFRAGPDTNALSGPDYRAGWFRSAHFTGAGQQAAGLMWAAEVHVMLRDLAAADAVLAPTGPPAL